MRGVLSFDFREPRVIPRRLIEMSVDADEPVHLLRAFSFQGERLQW